MSTAVHCANASSLHSGHWRGEVKPEISDEVQGGRGEDQGQTSAALMRPKKALLHQFDCKRPNVTLNTLLDV